MDGCDAREPRIRLTLRYGRTIEPLGRRVWLLDMLLCLQCDPERVLVGRRLWLPDLLLEYSVYLFERESLRT